MNFRHRWLQLVSYVFIGFVVLLIVLMFGMPDFLGSSALSTSGFAAKVGNETITKRDLALQKNAIMERYGLNADQGSFITSQALEQLIQYRILNILADKAGFKPEGKAVDVVLASAYRNYFPEYIEGNRFNFTELENDFRRQRRSRSEFEFKVLESRPYETSAFLFNSLNHTNSLESQVVAEMNSYHYSVEIAVLTPEDIDDFTRKSWHPSEADIQKEFETEYQKKDKTATLTPIVREAIISSLTKRKSQERQAGLVKEITASLKESDFLSVARKYSFRLHNFRDLSLADSLDRKKPADWPSLAPLESSEKFLSSVFKEGQTTGPLETGGNIYLIRAGKLVSEGIPESPVATNQPTQHAGEIFSIVEDELRESVKVVRYSGNDLDAE